MEQEKRQTDLFPDCVWNGADAVYFVRLAVPEEKRKAVNAADASTQILQVWMELGDSFTMVSAAIFFSEDKSCEYLFVGVRVSPELKGKPLPELLKPDPSSNEEKNIISRGWLLKSTK